MPICSDGSSRMDGRVRELCRERGRQKDMGETKMLTVSSIPQQICPGSPAAVSQSAMQEGVTKLVQQLCCAVRAARDYSINFTISE